jgi:hypothetical protein
VRNDFVLTSKGYRTQTTKQDSSLYWDRQVMQLKWTRANLLNEIQDDHFRFQVTEDTYIHIFATVYYLCFCGSAYPCYPTKNRNRLMTTMNYDHMCMSSFPVAYFYFF